MATPANVILWELWRLSRRKIIVHYVGSFVLVDIYAFIQCDINCSGMLLRAPT